MFARRPLLAFASLTLALTACRKAEIASYRVPKEKEREAPAMPAAPASAPAPTSPTDMASTAVPTAAGTGLTWSAPTHWKPKPASSMRKGSYAISGEGGPDADLSITAFPGDVGGELANLNRWRAQIQLPPIAESELTSATTHADINGLHLTVVDITGGGATPQRILGAMIPLGDATWFIKLMGPAALVTREKAAFDEFLKTVKASGSSAAP
jgi:hypothetical protein